MLNTSLKNTAYLGVHSGLSLSSDSPVSLIFIPVTNLSHVLMGELYQEQVSSPITSRAHHACSAITGAQVPTLIDSPGTD